jgi:hypothetical protein
MNTPMANVESLSPDNSTGRLPVALKTELYYSIPRRNIRMRAVLTLSSWESYLDFKKQTCRKEREEMPSGLVFTTGESGYFSWEERLFHKELRKVLLPETSNDDLSKVDDEQLETLDPRLFASGPESLCTDKDVNEDKIHDKAAYIAHEKALFEDYLINKIFAPQANYVV